MKRDLDEMIAVMQAAKEGKEIEYRRLLYNPDEWIEATTPTWDWSTRDYRIKPEPPKPEYVPYESEEEFLQGQAIHGPYIKIEDAIRKQYVLPSAIGDTYIVLNEQKVTYETLTSFFYTWQDGTKICELKQ